MPTNAKSQKFLFTLYTTPWCGDCYRAKNFLNQRNLQSGKDYQEIDVSEHVEALFILEKVNNGMHSVPTFVFADGSSLAEPTNEELLHHLEPFL
jgi:mycoredoxin